MGRIKYSDVEDLITVADISLSMAYKIIKGRTPEKAVLEKIYNYSERG